MTRTAVPVRTSGAPAPGPHGRLAGVAFRNRGRVVLAWLAALALAFGLSTVFGGQSNADYSAPGSDSGTAHNLLRARFPDQGAPTITLIARAAGPVDAPGATAAVDRLVGHVATMPHVASVQALWPATRGPVSRDRRTVLIDVHLDVALPQDMPVADTEAILTVAHAASRDGLTVAGAARGWS